ncbi:MAG TPA: flagellar export chaperone FlgN [Planctomycetaceae bacterium]
MNPQLAAGYRTALGDYVARVEAVQAELLSIYRRKRAALAAADADVLRQVEPPERQAAERLKALVAERRQMLAQAERFGMPHGSLAEVAAAVGCDAAIRERLAACRRRAGTLRREGWVHWVVAKRSLAQTAALLDLIAHRGDRPPTYDKPAATSGGTLLDASA